MKIHTNRFLTIVSYLWIPEMELFLYGGRNYYTPTLQRFKPNGARAKKLCQSSVHRTTVVFLQPESSSFPAETLEETSFSDWLGPCQREMRKQQIGWRLPRHRTEETGHSQCHQFAVEEKCGECELRVDDCRHPEKFHTRWLGRP